MNLYIYDEKDVYLLGVIREKCSSSAENLQEIILSELQDYGIEPTKIKYMISDSARNLIKLSKLMQW